MARRDWLHLLIFKLGWFVAVVGGANWVVWQVLLVAAAVVVVRPSVSVAGLVLAAAAMGVLRDAGLAIGGVLELRGGAMPVWLVLLWVQFALVLHRGMHWLAKLSQPVQVMVGVVTGTLAYFAAVSLGAGSLGGDLPVAAAWAVIAVTWGALLCLQIRLVNFSTYSGEGA